MKNLLAFLAFVLLLTPAFPVRAQRFSVTVDTVTLNIIEDGQPWPSISIYSAVKYHDYCFLNLHTSLHTSPWKDTLVAVSVDGKDVKAVARPFRSRCWGFYGKLFVRNDTLFCVDDINADSFSGYYFDEASWSWRYLPYIGQVIYEDDDFIVRMEPTRGRRRTVCFTEKQNSFYMETKNGWLQMEPYHRRYNIIYSPKRIIRSGNTYYFLYEYGVDTVNVRQRPGLELRKTAFPDIVWGDNADVYNYNNGYYHLNDTDDVKHLFGMNKRKPWWVSSDTIYDNAFCVDNQVYYVIYFRNTRACVAQIVDNQLIEVYDLGAFTPCSLLDNTSYFNRNFANNQCVSICLQDNTWGVLDIKDTGIHIRYYTK